MTTALLAIIFAWTGVALEDGASHSSPEDRKTASTSPSEVNPDRALESRLKTIVAAYGRDHDDQQVHAALEELGVMKESDLEGVKQFAISGEGRPIAWALVRVLVEHGKFASSSEVLVKLLQTSADPEQRMWKWWAANFAQRDNYAGITKAMVEALCSRFADAGEPERRVIARTLGQGDAGAALAPSEFRRRVLGESHAQTRPSD